MAPQASNMTRSSSSDSSALSNILVATVEGDGYVSDHALASTPPTSVQDTSSLRSVNAVAPLNLDGAGDDAGNSSWRPKRARSGPSSYNVRQLLDNQDGTGSRSSRNVSGLTDRTLVEDDDDQAFLGKKDDDSAEEEIQADSRKKSKQTATLQRRPSVKDKVKAGARKLGSVLGKRGREVLDAGKRKLKSSEVEESPKQNKIMKELDMGTRGVLDEMDLSDDELITPPPRPTKRAKITKTAEAEDSVAVKELTKSTGPPLNIKSGKQKKKWQREGLYVGQDADMDPTQKGSREKLQKKQRPDSSDGNDAASEAPAKTRFMSLPMYGYLDKTRDFVIPFDIFAPSLKKGDERPKDWTKLNKNRIVGEAKQLWEKEDNKLPVSICICEPPEEGEQSCGEDCLNRVMHYECNENNCGLPASQCGNRAFAELATRMKRGSSYDIGVEVVKTNNRGFGIRSCRTYGPGQIVMEYTGEIISEGECQRRMREEYKDKQCYYLMELERGLIIDGTKGCMARFINHSCDPNCEVRMVKVNGTPRMAVFAGENGIMTGEELTYDYNFDNFGETQQKCYCGAANCRGYLSKRLNATEQKKRAKEEEARKRKAQEEAQKVAEAEARRKKVKTDRGSSWRGWVAVDDPETKEKLKAEKKAKEEAEKSSSRAQRLAARRSSLPPHAKSEPAVEKKTDSKRRRTAHLEQATGSDAASSRADTTETIAVTETTTHKRTVSTSKFREELDIPSTTRTTTSTEEIVRKTEISVSTTGVRVASEDEEEGVMPLLLNGADDDGGVASGKGGLARTASKGREAVRSFGEAARKALGAGKLKQSTLNFARLSE